MKVCIRPQPQSSQAPTLPSTNTEQKQQTPGKTIFLAGPQKFLWQRVDQRAADHRLHNPPPEPPPSLKQGPTKRGGGGNLEYKTIRKHATSQHIPGKAMFLSGPKVWTKGTTRSKATKRQRARPAPGCSCTSPTQVGPRSPICASQIAGSDEAATGKPPFSLESKKTTESNPQRVCHEYGVSVVCLFVFLGLLWFVFFK